MLSVSDRPAFRIVLLILSVVATTSCGCRATSGWVYNSSGKAYYARGQYAMARDEFRRAAYDAPWNPDYRHNLAMAMKHTGDTNGAEHVLRQNLTQVSAMHQPTYHSLAQLLVDQNRHAEAQDLLAGWSQSQPYVPESHIEMAWIQRQSGDLPGAEQSLRQALQVNPRHPKALAHFGQLYQDAGQPDRAAHMYQRSLASRWGQPDVQSRLQTLAGGPSYPPTRSTMMVNAGSPVLSSGPMPAMAMSPAMTVSSTPTVINGPPMITATPMWSPTPDRTAMAMSAPSSPPVVISSDPMITFEQPAMTIGPSVTPNADPAHAEVEMTAELPLVAPH